MMSNDKKYLWYKIKPFSTSAGEKYDEKKDEDLLLLCKNIPDILFQVLKTPKDRTTLTLRVPQDYGRMVDSIDSFGSTLNVSAVGMKIQLLSTLHLAEKSVYPLVYDKNNVGRNLFSTFKDMPFGVFGLKLCHATSHRISKQYDSIRKKNKQSEEKNVSKIDPYESKAKQKAECQSFFHCEMFYGVRTLTDDEDYEKLIPYFVSGMKPNHLIRGKRIVYTDKQRDRANDLYADMILSKPKKTSMILSDLDLLPFVRFPENPYNLGLDSAQTPTTSNTSTSESAFDHLDEEFRE
jgi:hypothetical protein